MKRTINRSKTLISRLCIGIVTFFNLQCAVVFLIYPERYSYAFGVSGLIGEMIVFSFGLLFVMWNVPYIFALIDPGKFSSSYLQAVFMQAIGFAGESFLYFSNLQISTEVSQNIRRFMVFDGLGLLLLLLGYVVLTRGEKHNDIDLRNFRSD